MSEMRSFWIRQLSPKMSSNNREVVFFKFRSQVFHRICDNMVVKGVSSSSWSKHRRELVTLINLKDGQSYAEVEPAPMVLNISSASRRWATCPKSGRLPIRYEVL
jgi:hypothetical protein